MGVPIYWLNGNKVADDYADFYDEDWDEEAVNKNELGANGPNTSNSGNYPITGCDHDGTDGSSPSGDDSNRLGGADGGLVTIGRPNSSISGDGPLSSTSTTGDNSDRPMYGLSEVFKVVAAPPTEVPADWSLIPAGLTTGDTVPADLPLLDQAQRHRHRHRDLQHLRADPRRGRPHRHPGLQRRGSRVVGCTADTSTPVVNTGTTGGGGVPIYWLNGAKVADDYADFYDGDWDEEAVNKNELGENGLDITNSDNYPMTGCDHDGTESFALEANLSSVGLGTSTWPVDASDGPTPQVPTAAPSSADSDVLNGTDNHPMYGLSAVFGVGVEGANSDPTFPMSTAVRERGREHGRRARSSAPS